MVSVIVPCYNEGPTLANCLVSMTKQTYENFEIIIVNDGSTDNTKEIAALWAQRYPERIRLISKPNGGKGSALNCGIENSKGEIIVSLDADSVFLKNTLENLIAPFSDKSIGAVGGNVKVSNRQKLLNKHQAVEYISGLNINRRVFAYLSCMQVIAGAIGAFRKAAVLKVGGYSTDTLVEDMDLTVQLAERGYRVEYNSAAIAYTEAPDNLGSFIKQRYRWTYGSLQVLRKHRHAIFNPKYGNMGMIGLPYFLIFPWLDVSISVLFVATLARLIVSGSLQPVVFFSIFALTMALQIGMVYYALHIDKEEKSLTIISAIETLWYHYLINAVTIRAGFDYMRGKRSTWNKFARLGQNIAPIPTSAGPILVKPIEIFAAAKKSPAQQAIISKPIVASSVVRERASALSAPQKPSYPAMIASSMISIATNVANGVATVVTLGTYKGFKRDSDLKAGLRET